MRRDEGLCDVGRKRRKLDRDEVVVRGELVPLESRVRGVTVENDHVRRG